MDEHGRRPPPLRLANRNRAVRRFDLRRFHQFLASKTLSRSHPSWPHKAAKADRPSLPPAFRVLRRTIVTGERDSEREPRRRVPVIFAAKGQRGAPPRFGRPPSEKPFLP